MSVSITSNSVIKELSGLKLSELFVPYIQAGITPARQKIIEEKAETLHDLLGLYSLDGFGKEYMERFSELKISLFRKYVVENLSFYNCIYKNHFFEISCLPLVFDVSMINMKKMGRRLLFSICIKNRYPAEESVIVSLNRNRFFLANSQFDEKNGITLFK